MISSGKFARNYRLDIYTPGGEQITIAPPFSIQFSITRNVQASANTLSLTLFNLGAGTRNRIYKDKYTLNQYWHMELFAGYGQRLHEVFRGNIYEAQSYKDSGKTEWITQIEAFDGLDAIQNGFTATSIQAGTDKGGIIKSIISDMPNVVAGILGSPAQGESSRGQVLLGSSADVLAEQTNGQYFIDGETVNVLSDDEVLPGSVILLDSSLLLSTPRRRETFLDVSTLFEGSIAVGRIYEIQSIDPRFDGQYKVMGFTHNVTISEAMSGDAKTDIQLYFGANGLREVS